MSPEHYHQQVNGLSVGKKLPKAVYLHKSALGSVDEQLQVFAYQQVATLGLEEQDWEILKFHRDSYKLTILSYPSFVSDAYPALSKSISIDLAKQQCKETCYQKTDNRHFAPKGVNGIARLSSLRRFLPYHSGRRISRALRKQ